MLCAHLDTVPHDAPVEVVESDGVFRSRGETLPGADDKAAVAVLVELAARAAADAPAIGVELVLTVAEEDGLRGARGMTVGNLFTPDGTHIASIAQEVLLRERRPAATRADVSAASAASDGSGV